VRRAATSLQVDAVFVLINHVAAVKRRTNKREWDAVYGCILQGIRIEVEGPGDLPRMQEWLSRHRGQTLELDRARQLEFGVPVSAARAVLVAVTLQDGDPMTAQLGGVVRAIANRSLAEPVRLVFEGRSPAHLRPEDAETAASELLGTISRLVAEGGSQQARASARAERKGGLPPSKKDEAVAEVA